MFGGNVQMQLPITGMLEPLYADNLTFVGLITINFGVQAKVCFEIILAYAPVSILYVTTQSLVWNETYESELFFWSVLFECSVNCHNYFYCFELKFFSPQK